LINASADRVFAVTSDVLGWPEMLPHYRYVRLLRSTSRGKVIKMAARRDGIPVSWVSELIVDGKNQKIHFEHLRAFTKGMIVTWSFDETQEGTLVRIVHDLNFRIRFLAPLAERIIGEFFIESIAGKTLTTFKRHLESHP
jgi:ribosome-associated toxin RatA of RatAB toxin-antitoxin module